MTAIHHLVFTHAGATLRKSAWALPLCMAAFACAPAGAAAPDCSALSRPIYQVINPSIQTNLLTPWQNEAASVSQYGFTQSRGAPFQASLAEADGLVAAHRLYNPASHDFIWITSPNEIASATRNYGYVDQGINFYVSPSPSSCTQPVYRFLRGKVHRFAVSQEDQDALTASGWTPEGVMFHGGTSPTDGNTGSPPMPHGVPGNWTLTFDDEFNGAALDTTKWAPCWFHPSCGEKNGVSTNPDNVSVSGGNLVLTLSSPTVGALVSTNPNGGATKGYQFTTGVVEARIFFPGDANGCYNWPAWWTNGRDWPADGENDIAEVLEGVVKSNYHYSSATGQPVAVDLKAIGGATCGQWHIYTLNRQAGYSEVYLDGILVKKYDTFDTGTPHYLILNVGYDGSHVMTGEAGAVKVDWVRAWQ